MEDMISRNDAYNTLTEYYHHTTEIQHKALREALAHVPTAQPKSANELAEKVQNAPNDDFISRKAAIEIASGFCHLANIASELAKLPSAQPETHEERTETHSCDCISRQAAIDVCNKAIDLWQGQLGEGIVIAVRKKIEELPSAQPEITECPMCPDCPDNCPLEVEHD